MNPTAGRHHRTLPIKAAEKKGANKLLENSDTSGMSSGSTVAFRVWKNILMLNLGAFFIGSSSSAIKNVQSTLNSEGGLGVMTLAADTTSAILGGFLAGPLLVRFDCKWVYLVANLPLVVYVGANFFPIWAVFIPVGIIYGLGRGILSVALKVLMARLCQAYYQTYNVDPDRITTRIFLAEVLAFKVSSIAGNLASTLFLKRPEAAAPFQPNSSSFECGAYYCNEKLGAGPHDSQPTPGQVHTLIVFCLLVALLGCLVVMILVEPVRWTQELPVKNWGTPEMKRKLDGPRIGHVSGSLRDTYNLLFDRRLLLILPTFFIYESTDSFWMADFNKAFVSCSSGVAMVGVVSMWTGVSGGIASLAFGLFNSKGARSFPLCLSLLVQIGVLLALLFWTPSAGSDDNYLKLSLLTAFWFLASGIRRLLISSLLVVVFHNNVESSFMHHTMWSNGMAALFFAVSNAICVYFKIHFLLVLLVLALIGYITVEIKLNRENHQMSYAPIKNLDDN